MSAETLWTILGWALTGAALTPLVHDIGPRSDQRARPINANGAVAVPALVTFVLFGLLAWRFSAGLELVALSVLALFGVRLAAIDLAERRLPTSLIVPLYPATLGLLSLAATLDGRYVDLLRALLGMIALPAAFLAVAILSKGGFGAGDIRLAGPIGLTLAWQSWTAVMVGTVLAFVYASLMATVMLVTGRSAWRSPVPFGPAMLGGAFTAALLYQPL